MTIKSLEESVVIAMDGTDKELFRYLPYILQDTWEMGADPEIIIRLIEKHCINHERLKILDLGCGKGIVSVKAAKRFGCTCFGIDAVPEFISDARKKAAEYNVEKYCSFEVGDIRLVIKDLPTYDIIILGAIGSVFGDYYYTLTVLSVCLKWDGIFIIDDGYINDNSDFVHSQIQKQWTILHQINSAGMQLVEEEIIGKDDIKQSDDLIFDNLQKRCHELSERYPQKKQLFNDYLKKQKEENYVLENMVTCSTMVIRRIEPLNKKPDYSY